MVHLAGKAIADAQSDQFVITPECPIEHHQIGLL
jgi:hypothetical protein